MAEDKIADDKLDINKDTFIGDINDLDAALAMLSEAYMKRYDIVGQTIQGATQGTQAGNLMGGFTPFGSIVGGVAGAISGAQGGPSDAEVNEQKKIVMAIAQKAGLNSDEANALIESTIIQSQYEEQNKTTQKQVEELINSVNNLGKVTQATPPLTAPTIAGAWTDKALSSKESIKQQNTDRINRIKETANNLGIDISKIDLTSKNVEATKDALLSEVNKYYNENTGQYSTPNLPQPSEEEKKKIEIGLKVGQKVLSKTQGGTATQAVGTGMGTGVDMSVPSGGATSGTTTLPDGTVVSGNVDTSRYNTFLNADDPNAFIGITDPTGKTQTVDKNGQVVTGVQATYQYKDVMGDKGWNGLDETGRIALKKFLYAGNFYGASDVLNLGSANITETDVKALTSAMAAANINGVDVNTYLKPMYEEFLYTGRPFGEKPVDLNGDGRIDEYDQNNVTALKGFFQRNGLSADENYIATYDKAIRSGATTLAEAQQEIREKMIAPSYAGWADQINKGMDLDTIASPYKSKVSEMLGIDSSMIDINDPIMKSILNNKNEEGKPVYTTMEDAEKIIRQDPRWRASDRAQKEVVDGMYQMMQRFGIF